MNWRVIFVLTAGLSVATVRAYEIGTHSRITDAAFSRSVLQDAQFLAAQLGLNIVANDEEPFGEVYYDMAGNQVSLRARDRFELNAMSNAHLAFLPSGWIMAGAIREDDWTGLCGKTADNPQDDPYSNPPDRPKNHFFDPYHNIGLSISGFSVGQRAPDWALGVADAFGSPNAPVIDRRNHFTVFDAREAMYRALTLRAKNQDGTYSNLGPFLPSQQEAERKRYWATTFRALGDILHLNQDMAQPQHTRNDRHGGACLDFTGHESVYEKYIEARATGASKYTIDGQLGVPIESLSSLLSASLPVPTFSRYNSFWSTNPGVGSLTGDGLADYSNRSFFTAGTNLGSNDFTSPSNDSGTYTPVSIAGLLPAQPNRQINFLRGGSDNLRMTTESVFKYAFISGPRTYSLNRFNYDDMAGALIPRAVAYSAGLINYFFRGRLEITVPANNVYAVIDHGVPSGNAAGTGGFHRIRAQVRNITPNNFSDENGVFPQHMSGGRLEAVVKFHRNTCYSSDLSGEYGAPGQTPADRFANCRSL